MQTLFMLLPVLQHSDVKIAYCPITTVILAYQYGARNTEVCGVGKGLY